MASLVCDKASSFLSDKIINLVLKFKDEACNNPTALTEKLFAEMRSSFLFPRQVREALEANRGLIDTAMTELSNDPEFIEVCTMMKDPAKAGQFETVLREQVQEKTKMLVSRIPVCATGATSIAPADNAVAAPAAGGRRRRRSHRSRKNNTRLNRRRKNRRMTKRR